MPPSASLKRPCLAVRASVKAPFAWPNSSLSMRPAGMAPQLTATKGCAALRRALVQRPRDELLARAALAGDEDGGVHGREPVHLAQHRLEPLALAEDALGRRRRGRPQAPVLAQQPLALLGLAEDEDDLLGLEGLLDVVVRTGADRLQRLLLRAVGAHHQHGEARVLGFRMAQHGEAIALGHAHVAQQHVVAARGQLAHGLLAVGHGANLVPVLFEHQGEDMADGGLVVGDEDGAEGGHGRLGPHHPPGP